MSPLQCREGVADGADPRAASGGSRGAAAFELHDVVRTYGDRFALSLPQLHVAHGETLAIVGPSGAGKTTLLKLLALLEPPDRGTVLFRGRPTAGLATAIELRRRIAMVFQRPRLLSRSVAANVAFGLEVRGQRGRAAQVHALLHQFGLDDFADRHATQLSGGEQQRVALARALAVEPDVLLLDEPTAHLDPAHVSRIEVELRRLTERRPTTIVLATHHVFQAKRLADRVALLLDGRLVELSETRQFFDAPADRRTAAFLRGDMVY